MTRSMPKRCRALPIAFALVAAGWPALASAQTTPAPAAEAPATPSSGDTIRLSDAQRDAILENNTVESAAAARGEMAESEKPGLNIHGEVGVMVGSNGTRGLYGTAAIPLGDNAGAVVSFENYRSNGYRR